MTGPARTPPDPDVVPVREGEALDAEPSPWPIATGSMPAMIASVVIRMGRSRARSASICASSRGIPRSRSTLV